MFAKIDPFVKSDSINRDFFPTKIGEILFGGKISFTLIASKYSVTLVNITHMFIHFSFSWKQLLTNITLEISDHLLRSSLFETFVHSGLNPIAQVSNLSKFQPVVAEIFLFPYFEFIFHWRSSSFDIFVHCSFSLEFE